MESEREQNQTLAPVQQSLPQSQLSDRGVEAHAVVMETGQRIKEGLEEPFASTGTPIKDLSGGAKFMAQMSNIGGGSLEVGGGGIKEGFGIILANADAQATLRTELQQGGELPKGIESAD